MMYSFHCSIDSYLHQIEPSIYIYAFIYIYISIQILKYVKLLITYVILFYLFEFQYIFIYLFNHIRFNRLNQWPSAMAESITESSFITRLKQTKARKLPFETSSKSSASLSLSAWCSFLVMFIHSILNSSSLLSFYSNKIDSFINYPVRNL